MQRIFKADLVPEFFKNSRYKKYDGTKVFFIESNTWEVLESCPMPVLLVHIDWTIPA